MEKTTLPAARSTIVDGRGLPTPTFYRFLQSLTRIQDGSASDDDLQTLQDEITRIALALGSPDGSVEHIPPGQNQAPTLQVSYPLVMSGLLQNGFAIVEWDTGVLDDSDNVTLTYTPGSKIVADLTDITDSGAGSLLAVTVDAKGRVTGTRDATITGTAGRVTVAHGDASDGLPTIDLAEVTDAGGGALLKISRDAWGRVAGTSQPDTGDLPEGENLYYTDARADARIVHAKGQPDGIASLVSGKLDPGQLPALAITETFVVNTQAAMLALDCEQGDVAVRTDLSKSFILTAEPASTLANWQELLTPAGGVTSFNGRTGSVTPASGDYTPAQVGAEPAITAGTTSQYRRGDKTWQTLDKSAVGLGNVDNTSDADKPVSTAQQAAIDGLVPSAALINLSTSMLLASGTNLLVPFDDQILDDDSWWSSSAPTRLTVPAGIGRVRITINAAFIAATGGNRRAALRKNGIDFDGRCSQRIAPSGGVDYLNASTGVIEVSPGDYFELSVNQTSGSDLYVLGGSAGQGIYTWMSIESVPSP